MRKRVQVASLLAMVPVVLTLAHPGHVVGTGVPGAVGPLAWEARGFRVLSHIPINEFPGTNGYANDCWGYTSPSQREYAIIGFDSGIGFVEITDPANPTIVGSVNSPTSLWHDFKTVGSFVYAVTEGGGGIQVIDLTNIDSGVVVDVGNVGSGPTHNIAANPDSGYIYRLGGGSESELPIFGLRIYDTSNPAAPSFVAAWDDYYVHDAQVVTYDSGPWAGREVAFCCTGLDRRLRIVDVTDKANITELGSVMYSSPAYSHQGWLSPDRQYFYLNDELDEDAFGITTRTRIINVSDLENPFEVGTYSNGNAAIDHNLYTRDQYIFATNYRSGLRVLDATDPVNPIEVAYLDTFSTDDAPEFDGAWSNYPYCPSGVIILSDIQQGLIIAEFTPDRLDIDVPVPTTIDPVGGTQLEAMITQAGVTLDPTSVMLHLDDGSGTCDIPAEMVGAMEYRAITPPVQCGSNAKVRYWFSATTTSGETYYGPSSAPAFAPEVPVGNGSQQLFLDDFEADLGWTVIDDGNLTAGTWERGIPVGGGDRGDPAVDFDGSGSCFLTQNEDGNTDVDDGTTTLVSPRFDATGGTAVVSYAVWFVNSILPTIGDDQMSIEVSNDDGDTWAPLETVGLTSVEAWLFREHIIGDFIEPTATMRVRFIVGDLNQPSLVEAGVDEFRVDVITCCPIDMNSDGTLEILDLLTFLSLWFEGDAAAERSGDWPANVTIDDLLSFLSVWFEGC